MSESLLGESCPGGGTAAARQGQLARARRGFVMGIGALVALVGISFLAFVPSSVVLSPEADAGLSAFKQVSPQGWAFFTRNPREPYNLVYQKVDGEWQSVSSVNGSGADNFFGANRVRRTEYYEIQMVADRLPQDRWHECDLRETMTDCLPESPAPEVTMDSHGEDLRYCGVVAYTRIEPVPWAWATMVEEMPGEYALVDVTCHEMRRGEPV